MLKKSTNYINLISFFILIYLAFIPLGPSDTKIYSVVEKQFSIEKAFSHVRTLSQSPHYVGASSHPRAQHYIVKQLQELGLEVKVQKTSVANSNKTFTTVENIIAKIAGSEPNRKALLLMSHYDSAASASLGASDAASGVAVILEGLRGYLNDKKKPKNDIIILISDAEEMGLLGAKAFVNKHQWAQNIGAVLNFEARGTSGSSIMLMETNHGNRNLLKTFMQTPLSYPTSNSLAYSIYKLLPNDTDLSVFRVDKDIIGFNFAFIDNHFNYHTALDSPQNLSLDSLAHQAHYLMPLLDKLSQMDLTSLQSDEDDVYFQIPFWKTIKYPFDYALIFSVINLLLFLATIAIGLRNKSLQVKSMLLASTALFKSLIISVLISFAALKFLYWLHPQYAEILQGFTYNSYAYIALFSLLAFGLCFFFYQRTAEKFSASNMMAVPLLLWIVISTILALTLTGAHFFILISFVGTLSLLINVLKKQDQPSLTLLLFAPVVLIFSPFMMQLPVALGLMIVPFSGALLILICAPLISCMHIPGQYGINKWLFISAFVAVLAYAEYHASIDQSRPLPDSINYLQDQQTKQAYMFSYDLQTDDWTKPLLSDQLVDAKNWPAALQVSYWRFVKMVAPTENRQVPVAQIEVSKDRLYSDRRVYQLKITLQRKVERINIVSNNKVDVLEFSINAEPLLQAGKNRVYQEKELMAKIFTAKEHEFVLDLAIDPQQQLDLTVIEISANLLNHPDFEIKPRSPDLIPKPFLINDAIITQQKIVSLNNK
jgi:hypothetical protein